MKKCPYCAEEIQDAAIICRYCGRDQPAKETPISGIGLPSQPQPFQPWLSIWTKPRETIRKIIDTDPKKYVILLAILGGISYTPYSLYSANAGDTFSLNTIFARWFITGIINGILYLYIYSAVLLWIGNWLKGQASYKEVKAVYAWSSVPAIATLPLWILTGLIGGKELFSRTSLPVHLYPILLLVCVLIISLVAMIWDVVISLKGLSEINRFSTWKALAVYLLGSLIIWPLSLGVDAVLEGLLNAL